jgi:hypothetical protein
MPATVFPFSVPPRATCCNGGSLPDTRDCSSGLVYRASITPKSARSFDARAAQIRCAQTGDSPTTPGQTLVKLTHRRSLIGTHPSSDDMCFVVILSAHRHACQAPQHRDLSDMRERIGYRSLEELFGRFVHRLLRSQICFECLKSRKETPDFGIPWKRIRITPLLLALRDRKSPLHQVTDMCENLARTARLIRYSKLSK